MFYSLFGVINELRKFKKLRIDNLPKIKSALMEIDNILEMEPEDVEREYFQFYDTSSKHVTDLKARKIRHSFILDFILKQAKIK